MGYHIKLILFPTEIPSLRISLIYIDALALWEIRYTMTIFYGVRDMNYNHSKMPGDHAIKEQYLNLIGEKRKT